MARSGLNLAQSVHHRLLNRAREQGEDFNLVLIRYMLERFLYRLGCSRHKDSFVLKGAMLFAAWTDQPPRPTRDLDLLGIGDSSDEALVRIFREIARTPVEPDGLVFDGDGISISEIREAQDYPGKRIKLPARLGNARLNLQIDVGFGDAVTPEPAEIVYPALLDMPAPRVRAYPCETVIAEKLQALVAFDVAISRMKDFYDMWTLSKQFPFEGASLSAAIAATFNRRSTPIPNGAPTALTSSTTSGPFCLSHCWLPLKDKPSRNRGDQVVLGRDRACSVARYRVDNPLTGNHPGNRMHTAVLDTARFPRLRTLCGCILPTGDRPGNSRNRRPCELRGYAASSPSWWAGHDMSSA